MAEPSDNLLANLAKVLLLTIVTAFFWSEGDESPEKVKERQEKWPIDFPEKTVEGLQRAQPAGSQSSRSSGANYV